MPLGCLPVRRPEYSTDVTATVAQPISFAFSASYLMWAVQSTVVEKLLEKGLKPSVYISNHMPDAARINGEALENYEKYGF